jgi:hypothetical protein
MDKIGAAARLFEDFTGHRAGRVRTLRVPDMDDTHLLIGEAEGIAYNTVRDGERESYVHEFRRGSRPLLTASHDGKRLYLLDGAYRFTDRGIVDKSRSQMPAEIAIVNPSRRKGHRTAAQKRATAKLLAWNRAHRGHKSRKSNPSHRHHHGGHHRTAAQRAATRKLIAWNRGHRSHNPGRALTRFPGRMGGFMGELVPAGIGAAGGLGINILVGYLPLPVQLKTGFVRTLVVLGAVWAGGAVASMAFGRRVGNLVTAGGVTVTIYDLLKGLIVQNFPNVPLQPTAVVAVPTAAVAAPGSGTTGVSGWIAPALQMSDMGTYVDGMGDPALVRAY